MAPQQHNKEQGDNNLDDNLSTTRMSTITMSRLTMLKFKFEHVNNTNKEQVDDDNTIQTMSRLTRQ